MSLLPVAEALDRILANSRKPGHYEPHKWVHAHFGDANSGARLLRFVQEHFADRVKLPEGTTGLFPRGA